MVQSWLADNVDQAGGFELTEIFPTLSAPPHLASFLLVHIILIFHLAEPAYFAFLQPLIL